MRELVLTHLDGEEDGVALIALVDYERYTVSVKKTPFTGNYKDSKEIGGLLSSGKLRPYRKDLRSLSNAWLAHDAVRGELMVTMDGDVLSGNLRGFQFSSGNDVSNPKILGGLDEGDSFWGHAERVMAELGRKFYDKKVHDELFRTTGVFIKYELAGYESSVDRYFIQPNGVYIDKIVLKGKRSCEQIEATVRGLGLHELHISGCGELRVCGSFDTLMIDDSVESVSVVSDSYYYYNEGETANAFGIVPLGSNSKLNKLSYYNKMDADLSAFSMLNTFEGCWFSAVVPHYLKSSKIALDEDTPVLNLRLSENAGLVTFKKCFNGVNIDTILPYASNGRLDITGMHTLQNSFKKFKGIQEIVGDAAYIIDSFVDGEYVGAVNVGAFAVASSFCTGSRHTEAKNRDECVIRLNIQEHYPSEIGKEIIGNSYDNNYDYAVKTGLNAWKQVNIIDGFEDMKIRMHGTYDGSIRFIVNTPLLKCSVWGDKKNPAEFKDKVAVLVSGSHLYKGVGCYDDKCFSSNEFNKTWIAELEEGVLLRIGDRCFRESRGIKYLVIPRSVEDIGTAAFSEMMDGNNGFTTICVYRDSWAHKQWSKGKNLQILVIDSIDDIPKETSEESETDFIAAFVETPNWAQKSKAFVAKLLHSATTADIYGYVNYVTEVDGDVKAFLDNEYKLHKDEIAKKKKKMGEEGISSAGIFDEQPVSSGCVPAMLRKAIALQAVFGSETGLLDTSILRQFSWEVKRAGNVTYYDGMRKIRGKDDARSLRIYTQDDKVLYVGCADCFTAERMVPHTESARKMTVMEALFEPAVENRLYIDSYSDGYNKYSVHVNKEYLEGDASKQMTKIIDTSLYPLSSVYSGSSGRMQTWDVYVYDIYGNALRKFNSTNAVNGVFGTYCGTVGFREMPYYDSIKETEAHYLSLKGGDIEIPAGRQAKPSYEAEFARRHSQFNLEHQVKGRVSQFIEFMSGSGLVKQITNSAFEKRWNKYFDTKWYEGGSCIEYGKSGSGYTYLYRVTYKPVQGDEVVKCFECTFNAFDLLRLFDVYFAGGKKYTAPDKGFMCMVDSDNLAYVDIGNKVRLAISLESGKLCLTHKSYYGETGIICSFDSAKDAREFYEAFGGNILRPVSKEMESAIADDIIDIGGEDGPKLTFRERAYRYSMRVPNSFRLLGGMETPESVKESRYDDLYDEAVLKYCRL